MKATGEPPQPPARALEAALLDYYQRPGRYELTLRQPAVLFASIREVLQLASGRGASSGARDAAVFFLQAALLYPGADHYAVLGCASGMVPEDLKVRYRLLMRLIHPDYAATNGMAWPADAAGRVNRAYTVLSSPVLRREYDEQCAGREVPRPRDAAVERKLPRHRAAAPQQRRWARGKLAWALLGIAAVGLVLMLLPAPEPHHLVQRPARIARPAPVAATSIALPQEPPRPGLPDAALAAAIPAPVPPAAEQRPAVAMAAAGNASRIPMPGPVAPFRVPAELPRPQSVAAPEPVREPALLVPLAPNAPLAQAPAFAAAPVPAAAVPAPIAVTDSPPGMPVHPQPPSGEITRVAAVAAAPQAAAPTMVEAQPVLSQLLQTLESGNSRQMLYLLEADARLSPSAVAFSRQYEQAIRGVRPVRVSHVEFKGERREGRLLVTGRMRLHAGDTPIGSMGNPVLLRAEFAWREGKVMLSGLGGGVE